MARYTSKIILVLAVPSIFGLLSIFFFKKKRLNSLKNSDTEAKDLLSSSTVHNYLKSMKLKQSCIESTENMHLKEDQTGLEQNKNAVLSYASCLKQIQSREVLITANGVQDLIGADFSELQIATSNGSKIITADVKSLKSIKKDSMLTPDNSIAEFSYYETGARPKVKASNTINGSSLTTEKEVSIQNKNVRAHYSASQNYLKFNGNSESKPKQVEVKNKAKVTESPGSGLCTSKNLSEKVNSSESFSNGVSSKVKSKKKSKGKLHGNDHSCTFTSTTNDCDKDIALNDNTVRNTSTLFHENPSKNHPVTNSLIKNMDNNEASTVQKDTQVRTENDELCNCTTLSDKSLVVNDQILDEISCQNGHFDEQYNSIGLQCVTPESGRSSLSEKVENLQVDVNANLTFSTDYIPNCHESLHKESETTYCDSVNFENLQLESYEVLFDGFLMYFQVPRFCASFLKNVPCVSKWSCPYFPEAEASNDSGKGASEIVFGVENQSTSMIYEFDFPSIHCGVLIGKKGSFVNYIKEKSNASIWIRNFPFNQNKKIVTLAGEEDEIKIALDLIREKFPPKRYVDISLGPTSFDSAQIVCPSSLKLSLPEGVEFQVVLSATVNAGHFFVQLPTHPSYHALPPFTMSMTSMYTHCDTPQITNPCVGNIVAAPVAEGWFRAEIIELFEDDTCKLKYLDYGGYQVVPRVILRQINIEYMQMPFQAIECYLSNVSCFEDLGWTIDAKTHFEELAQGQILSAYVAGIADNGVPCLYLYQINGATNTFINQALVEAGFLQWIAYEEKEAIQQ